MGLRRSGGVPDHAQFFFSRRALYLLVWMPREGREENAIEDWCRRIRLRVGDDARILIVATHADERIPELDYPELKVKFGDLIVGQHQVDSLSGRGIAELRDAIAAEASRLPHMGQSLSVRWQAARDEVLALGEPQVGFSVFEQMCAGHDMQDRDTETLARLMHELGQVIYYGAPVGLGVKFIAGARS
jgi:internalin A